MAITVEQRVHSEYLKRAAYDQKIAAQSVNRVVQFLMLANLDTSEINNIANSLSRVRMAIEQAQHDEGRV